MNTTLPGMPQRSNEALSQREAITTAVVQLHHAMQSLVEMLDSNASVSMKFKVRGDMLTVCIKPGKSNDGGF